MIKVMLIIGVYSYCIKFCMSNNDCISVSTRVLGILNRERSTHVRLSVFDVVKKLQGIGVYMKSTRGFVFAKRIVENVVSE